jgi:hypothetical protein
MCKRRVYLMSQRGDEAHRQTARPVALQTQEMTMKTMILAAALSIGVAGVALAEQPGNPQPSVQSQIVTPNQRASYLAHYEVAQNSVVLPNQRASYLAHYEVAQNSVVLPNQRAPYLA